MLATFFGGCNSLDVNTLRVIYYSGMKKGRLMTATVFAQEMGVDYSTVMRWLKRQLVPGAVLRESEERGKWWEIPEAALQMERPKWGGPKRSRATKPAKKSAKKGGQ